MITGMQDFFNGKGVLRNSLPHLSSRCDDMVREVLGTICIMLFNANKVVQVIVLSLPSLTGSWSLQFLNKPYNPNGHTLEIVKQPSDGRGFPLGVV